MKKSRGPRKLALCAETIAHLDRIATDELAGVRGGLRSQTTDPVTAAQGDCTKTGGVRV